MNITKPYKSRDKNSRQQREELYPDIRRVITDYYYGCAGDAIFVHADDNIGIDTVEVTITSRKGVLIEKGFATCGTYDWKYVTTTSRLQKHDVFIKVAVKNILGYYSIEFVVV